MNKTTKIALFSIGGLALATGLFFAIKAFIPKSDNEFDEKDQLDYNRLLEKERKGTLSDRERDELENLRRYMLVLLETTLKEYVLLKCNLR